jgi:hypothetical protein
MMQRALIILFTLVSVFSYAQQKTKADSAVVKPLKKDYSPTGIRFGTDLISLVKSQTRKSFSGWEAAADIDLNRYLLTAEIGNWGRNFSADSTGFSSNYSNKGNYWRAGVDVNFLTHDPERNVFSLGMRYGRSRYSESTTFTAFDKVWGPVNGNYSNNNISARWFELTMGLKVKIYKFIWMGYTGRLKFGLKKEEGAAMLSSDVPGYGNTDKENTFGFNYYVFFKIPFRKTTAIIPVTKKK